MSCDFALDKNRSYQLAGVAKDEDGAVLSIADPVRIVFRMESRYDPSKHLEKTTDSSAEILKTDPSAGEYLVSIRPSDTEDLPPGEYRYEVVYIDDPADPSEVYTLNPKEGESGLVELKDNLIEVA